MSEFDEKQLRAHTLPRALRRTYWAVHEAPSTAERHEHAFFLWQDTVLYLASLAFADYRSHRVGDPDPRAEAVLRKWPRPWTRDYIELLQASLAAGPQSGIFARSLADTVRLKHVERLRRGMVALEIAEASGGTTLLARILKEELAKPPAKKQAGSWGSMLELLGSYRNRAIGHKDRTSWRHVKDFYDCMAPLVSAVAFELLAHDDIRTVIDSHPVASLISVEPLPGGHARHVLKGEYLGTDRRITIFARESALDTFSQPSWRAEPDCSLLLDVSELHGEERFAIRTLFHDFLDRKDAPPALPAPTAASPVDPSASPTAPRRPKGGGTAIAWIRRWRLPLSVGVASTAAAIGAIFAIPGAGPPSKPLLEASPLSLRLLTTSTGPGVLVSQYVRGARSVTVTLSAEAHDDGNTTRATASAIRLKHLKSSEWALLTHRRDAISLANASGLTVQVRACNRAGCVRGGYGGPPTHAVVGS